MIGNAIDITFYYQQMIFFKICKKKHKKLIIRDVFLSFIQWMSYSAWENAIHEKKKSEWKSFGSEGR